MAGQWWGDNADLGRDALRELEELEREERTDAEEDWHVGSVYEELPALTDSDQ